MSIKINTPVVPSVNSKIQMSSGYYDAQTRFQAILSNKLGKTEAKTPTATAGSAVQAEDMLRFNPSNVTEVSGASAEVLNERFKGTAFEGLGDSFADAEKKYGINAWFLSGLAIHESNYGNSRIAQDKNNLFGFMAYDASPYSSAAQYGSRGDSIDAVAKYLSEQYTNPEGKYFNGTSVDSIGKRYATDPNWAAGINRRISALMK